MERTGDAQSGIVPCQSSIVEGFVREFRAELNPARLERGAKQAAATGRLEQIERQIDALVAATAEGIKSASVAAKPAHLEAEREMHATQFSLEAGAACPHAPQSRRLVSREG
jgi:hypothetical protein